MEANTVTQVQEKDLSPDLNVINNDVEDIKRLIANAKIDEPLPTDDHILEKPKQIVEPEIKFPLLKVEHNALISTRGSLNREMFKVVLDDALTVIDNVKKERFPDSITSDVSEVQQDKNVRQEERLRKKMDVNMLLAAEINAAKNDPKALRRMLFEDANLSQRRDFFWGYTLLHWAAKNNNCKSIKDLLATGANPNAQSHGGLTPLHTAAINGHTKAMRYLLEAGADIDMKSNSGEKAKDVATGDPRFLLQNRLQTWDYTAVKQVISSLKSQYM